MSRSEPSHPSLNCWRCGKNCNDGCYFYYCRERPNRHHRICVPCFEKYIARFKCPQIFFNSILCGVANCKDKIDNRAPNFNICVNGNLNSNSIINNIQQQQPIASPPQSQQNEHPIALPPLQEIEEESDEEIEIIYSSYVHKDVLIMLT